MILGMPTLIETADIDACARLCRKLGLNFIELSMSLPQYTVEAIDTDKFMEIAERYDIFYTIHLDENVNVCDFNTYIAKASMQYIADSISIANQLHSPVINMHLHRGEHFTLPEQKIELFELYSEHYLERIRQFRNLCENVAGESDVKICIENCKGYPGFQREALDILLTSPVFGLTLDIGHNHACEYTDEPYIIENQEHLCHMHMHDALGKKDHLALGTGEINLDKYILLAKKHSCRVVLETKTAEGLTQSVGYLRQKDKIKLQKG